MKRIIGYLMIVLLFAGSVCGAVFGVKYAKINEKYNENGSSQNEQIKSLQNTIVEYKKRITAYETTIDSNAKKLEQLNNELSQYKGLSEEQEDVILALQESIDELDSDNETLTAQIAALNQTIDELETALNQNETLIESYVAQLAVLESTIDSLDSTISQLNDSLKYYQELIECFDLSNKAILTFKVDGSTYDVAIVDKNGKCTAEIEEPAMLGYSFVGWSFDGETVVDLSTQTFAENTTLTALKQTEEQTHSTISSVKNYINQSNVSRDDSFVATITVNGSNVTSVDVGKVNGQDLLPIEIDLKNFASILGNKLIVDVPMSYIEENFPTCVPTMEFSSYFHAEFELTSEGLILQEYARIASTNQTKFDSKITSSDAFIFSDVLAKEYTVERKSMANETIYSAKLSASDGNIVLSNGTATLTCEMTDTGFFVANGTLGDYSIGFTFYVNESGVPVTLRIFDSYFVDQGGTLTFTEVTDEDEVYVPTADELVLDGGYLTGYSGTATEIKLPESVTSIMSTAFAGNTTLTSIIIPDSVTMIDMGAFKNCTALKSVSLPSTISTVDMEVFAGCSSLESIIIPDSVTTFGMSVFKNCSNLKTVVIEGEVSEISMECFSGCNSVEKYDFRNFTKVPELMLVQSLGHATGCQIIVPDALYDVWPTSGSWAALSGVTFVKASEVA